MSASALGTKPNARAGCLCAHCGLPAPMGQRFCCAGCGAAFDLIASLDLGRYYRERLLAPDRAAPRPPSGPRPDLARHVQQDSAGDFEITLAIDGLQCGACVWLIETVLAKAQELKATGLRQGRVNMTSRRLHLRWAGAATEVAQYAGLVEQLGYRLIPFETAPLAAAREAANRRLLRALAVAGFAAGNVMLLAMGAWFGEGHGMGPATRDLLHWLAALIALPAIAYAGRPFFTSAFAALRQRHSNMDVPISLGVILVACLSLWQTIAGGEQTYFESACMLLLFLLIGRVLDHRSRGQARQAAEHLLSLRSAEATVLLADGTPSRRDQNSLLPGDVILIGMGERIAADGVVQTADALLDASLVTGESLPITAPAGTLVFAGTLNLGAPLTLRVTAAGGATLLADCVRLIEAAETRRGRYVVLADRVARAYAPVVHLCALATLLTWLALGADTSRALLAAAAVLIITCPCALALAVPAVQVIATGGLFGAGVLLKSPTALERLAAIDLVCFDKTGTLTEPELQLSPSQDDTALRLAASLAATSRHPLARALCAGVLPMIPADEVVEHPGKGLSCPVPEGEMRLGSAAFCGVSPGEDMAELWFTRPGFAAVRFGFAEHLRPDAVGVITRLRAMGLDVRLISGDRSAAVRPVAENLGLTDWRADCSPGQKYALICGWEEQGHRVLMVGDGLNDGPALSAASVSASPSSAADLSQNVADLVFQGRLLAPLALAVAVARRARAVMRQNLALALGYNLLVVPLAMAGLVTPWLAAAAMSLSSLLVMANSARVRVGDAR